MVNFNGYAVQVHVPIRDALPQLSGSLGNPTAGQQSTIPIGCSCAAADYYDTGDDDGSITLDVTDPLQQAVDWVYLDDLTDTSVTLLINAPSYAATGQYGVSVDFCGEMDLPLLEGFSCVGDTNGFDLDPPEPTVAVTPKPVCFNRCVEQSSGWHIPVDYLQQQNYPHLCQYQRRQCLCRGR